jgi:hypothetical protein
MGVCQTSEHSHAFINQANENLAFILIIWYPFDQSLFFQAVYQANSDVMANLQPFSQLTDCKLLAAGVPNDK